MGLLIIQGKVQLCIFSLADLQSGKLKSDTNSLLPLYFTTESHFGFLGSSSILPHHLFLCIPPYTNTLNTWQYNNRNENALYKPAILVTIVKWHKAQMKKRKKSIKNVTINSKSYQYCHRNYKCIKKVKLKACLSLWLWDFFPSKCSKNGVLRNNPPNMEKR